MIQIIALRPFKDKAGKTRKAHRVVSKEWLAPSVSHLFSHWEFYRDSLPQKERWNIYYTALSCKPASKDNHKTWRKFASQKVIPFDIDGIDTTKAETYVEVICKKLKLDINKTGAVFTGNGIQLIIEINDPFTDIDYFDASRIFYKSICDSINTELANHNLIGSADSSVWSAARILRFGGTTNDKKDKGKGITEARFLQTNVEPQDFDLESISDIPQVDESEQLNAEHDYPEADNEAILNQCDFIKHCQENPEKVSEPEWYALLSITSRMVNGNELSHKFSEGHDNYSHAETETKIEQSMGASRPRTCKSINNTWGSCKGCKHYKSKLISPILIKSDDFIATEKSGFHVQIKDKEGNVKKVIPQYLDLLRYMDREGPHKVINQSGICYRWKDTHYEVFSSTECKGFAQTHFFPKPKNTVATEFKELVARTGLVPPNFFSSTDGIINFRNGVLDITTGTLSPHSSDNGFRYTLPYDYDPKAKAPRFKKFLQEVTGNDVSIIKILEEFGGYAISGEKCRYHKALVLSGEGKNGKSKFIYALQRVAGHDNYANVSLKSLEHENNRQLLEGKLFNISEETPTRSLEDSSIFKNIVSGGEILVKLMYNQPYFIENRCKIIFSCNELPPSKDTTYGLFRRLIIVPFDQKFEGAKEDKFLDDKFDAELPGIFNVFFQGYKRLVAAKEFTDSKTATAQLDDYREAIDSVVRFVNEFIEPTDSVDSEVPIDELYQSYKDMCESRGFYPKNDMVFSKQLGQVIPDYANKKARMRVDGRQVRTLKGIVCRYE